MMKTTKPIFSNGTEAMDWIHFNCEQCVKAIRYGADVQIKSLKQYRCAIQRDVDLQMIGCDEISQRSYDLATRNFDCPHKRTERKKYKRKRKMNKYQLNLF